MIRSMHGYNAWAMEQVLSQCDRVLPEQFISDAAIPWGSIRDQFVHMFIVHKRWISWVDGSLSGEESYALQADPADYPDVESVRHMWMEIDIQTAAFLDQLSSAQLLGKLETEAPGFSFSIPVWQVLIHLAHHSMQHRTEIATALTNLGASPGDIDYIFYVME